MDTQKEYIASLDTTPRAMEEAEQEAYDNLVYGSDTPEQTTDEKLDEILSLLRPLAPALQALPELMKQLGPIMEGIKKSPVLKALGVRL